MNEVEPTARMSDAYSVGAVPFLRGVGAGIGALLTLAVALLGLLGLLALCVIGAYLAAHYLSPYV
jgi:hypothetical protein